MADTLERACQLTGEEFDGVFSSLGDEFIYWCVTGEMMVPDSEYFGKQLVVAFDDRAIHLVKAEHHGIGIENKVVVNFSKRESRKNWDPDTGIGLVTAHKKAEKSQGPGRPFWKVLGSKDIAITTVEEFYGERTRYIYKYDDSDQERVSARNRAINCWLGWYPKEYSPVTNNCEHLSTWCKTGARRSAQVSKGVMEIGLPAALSGFGFDRTWESNGSFQSI